MLLNTHTHKKSACILCILIIISKTGQNKTSKCHEDYLDVSCIRGVCVIWTITHNALSPGSRSVVVWNPTVNNFIMCSANIFTLFCYESATWDPTDESKRHIICYLMTCQDKQTCNTKTNKLYIQVRNGKEAYPIPQSPITITTKPERVLDLNKTDT